MKTKLTFLIVSLTALVTTGNAQLKLYSGSKVVINGGTVANNVFVVLNSPPATPIQKDADVGNGIIMENEYNRLQYNLAALTTAITVPYMSSALEQFPLTVSSITAGTETGAGTGNIRFSTMKAATRATGFDNTAYMPSDVPNMNNSAGANGSAKTLDRFWIIDANGYSAKPAVTLDFTYIDAEWSANGGNTINENNLQLQRYDTGDNDWKDYAPAGTITTASNTITGVTAIAASFFRSWVMNDNSAPLPIELVKFESSCDGKSVVLSWETSTETNNNYFTIERSTDAINWVSIGTLPSAAAGGNSTQPLNYQFTDNAPPSFVSYYRLKQTDFNGDFKYFNIIASDCNQEGIDFINIYPNPSSGAFIYLLSSSMDTEITVKAYDAIGQLVKDEVIYVEHGVSKHSLDVSSLSNGVYYLQLKTTNGLYKGQKQFIIN